MVLDPAILGDAQWTYSEKKKRSERIEYLRGRFLIGAEI
jgi:hypothetical protein